MTMPSLNFLADAKKMHLISIKRILQAFIFIILLAFLHQTHFASKITCIHVPQPNPAPKSLGDLYQRTQLAFLLSSYLSASLSIASHTAFGTCPRPQPKQSCILHEADLMLTRCDRADCRCHAEEIAPHLNKVSHCTTLQLNVDEFSTSEFAGCTHKAVARYLPPQKGSYNVLVHSASGARTMSESETSFIGRQLCNLSDKQIVVIALSATKVPTCENRTMLATGLDDETVVRLIGGAENVGANGGEIVQMGVAAMDGGRLFLPPNSISEFDWAPVDGFTVLGSKGAVLHFDDVEIMREAINGGDAEKLIKNRSYRNEPDGKWKEYIIREVPKRRWSKNEVLA